MTHETYNISTITEALHRVSGRKIRVPMYIQNGRRAIQTGVEITFIAVATVDSGTVIGCSRYRLTKRNESRRSVVLRPGMGKTPNQNPNEMSRARSIHVISRKGVTRCFANQHRTFSNIPGAIKISRKGFCEIHAGHFFSPKRASGENQE